MAPFLNKYTQADSISASWREHMKSSLSNLQQPKSLLFLPGAVFRSKVKSSKFAFTSPWRGLENSVPKTADPLALDYVLLRPDLYLRSRTHTSGIKSISFRPFLLGVKWSNVFSIYLIYPPIIIIANSISFQFFKDYGLGRYVLLVTGSSRRQILPLSVRSR